MRLRAGLSWSTTGWCHPRTVFGKTFLGFASRPKFSTHGQLRKAGTLFGWPPAESGNLFWTSDFIRNPEGPGNRIPELPTTLRLGVASSEVLAELGQGPQELPSQIWRFGRFLATPTRKSGESCENGSGNPFFSGKKPGFGRRFSTSFRHFFRRISPFFHFFSTFRRFSIFFEKNEKNAEK
jgi:hypothetical protein